jgi:hypothetical protein
MSHIDSRLDPDSPDFNWQALADYNEDNVAETFRQADEEIEKRSEQIHHDLEEDTRFQVAESFAKDRIKGRSSFAGGAKLQDEDYSLDDVLRYAGVDD